MYKTNTYGLQWDQIDPSFLLFNNADIKDIEFPTRDTGFMAFRADQGGLMPFLFKTIDGGDNWTNITPPELVVGMGYMDIHFVNKDLGFVVSGNKVIRTDDGGDNWTSTTLGMFGGPKVIDFFNDSVGIAGAWDGTFLYKGTIYSTTDGGLSWDSVHFNSYQSSIEHVSYASPNVAYAMTGTFFQGGQKLYRSIDSGQNWDTLILSFVDTTDVATGVIFTDPSQGYICTVDGRIYQSSDSGNTWIEVYKDKSAMTEMVTNGTFIYACGPLNTLVTNYTSTGISNNDNENNIRLYPNPYGNTGVIRFSKPVSGDLRIYTETGKLLAIKNVSNSNQIELNRKLKPGIYFIQVLGNTSLNFKMIIE